MEVRAVIPIIRRMKQQHYYDAEIPIRQPMNDIFSGTCVPICYGESILDYFFNLLDMLSNLSDKSDALLLWSAFIPITGICRN